MITGCYRNSTCKWKCCDSPMIQENLIACVKKIASSKPLAELLQARQGSLPKQLIPQTIPDPVMFLLFSKRKLQEITIHLAIILSQTSIYKVNELYKVNEVYFPMCLFCDWNFEQHAGAVCLNLIGVEESRSIPHDKQGALCQRFSRGFAARC